MVFMGLKRRSIQQLDYSMAMSEPKGSTENKLLGHRMFFTLENQRNHRRKGLITKIIWQIYNYETNILPARCRAIQFISGTIAETKNAKIPHVMKTWSVCDVLLDNISKQVILKWLCCDVFMLLHGNHFLANGREHNKNKKYVEVQLIFSWFCWGVLDLFHGSIFRDGRIWAKKLLRRLKT